MILFKYIKFSIFINIWLLLDTPQYVYNNTEIYKN